MKKIICLFVFLSSAVCGQGQIITTVAGTGIAGHSGDGGPATNAKIGACGGIGFDHIGNYYFSEGQRIRKVSPDGTISTIAGSGTSGYSGDGGPATNADLNGALFVAFDKNDNVYIGDVMNNAVRKVDNSTGIISTYAGTGSVGFSGDGGPATNAQFNAVYGICFDAIGNLYLSDYDNCRIRMVDTTGIIHIYAGVDSCGMGNDGVAATNSAIYHVYGICTDKHDNLYLCDGARIRRIDPVTHVISTVAGDPYALSKGDGGPATSAGIDPESIVINSVGELYICEEGFDDIRKVDTTGIINTIAGTGVSGFSGDGGEATAAKLWAVRGASLDACGDLFICDNGNFRVRRVEEPPLLTMPSIVLSGSSSGVVGTTVTVDATVSSAGSSYLIYWMDDGVVFTTTTVPYVTYAKAAGTDTITARIVPTGYGCWDSTTSAPHIVGMSSEGAQSLPKGEGVMVYPNPAHGNVQVISNANISELTITNIPGQMVREKKCATAHEQMDINGLPPGLYLLRITDEYGTVNVVKLMVE